MVSSDLPVPLQSVTATANQEPLRLLIGPERWMIIEHQRFIDKKSD